MTLPVQGAAPWDVQLAAHLAVGHNADGSHKNIFNLKEQYGALGDGSTNDTAAIEAAIVAANAATNGGLIIAPPGNYLTTGAHTAIDDKVAIIGHGVGSTKFTHSGNNSCFKLNAPGVTNERVGISDLLVVGNSGNAACAVEIRDVNFGAWLTRVRATDYTGYGAILINNFASSQFTEGVTLDGVSTSNSKFGVAFHVASGTSSFNATHFKNLQINVPASGTGIAVCTLSGSAAGLLYNFTWDNVQIWFDNTASNFGIDIGASSTIRDGRIWVHGEGASGTTTAVRVGAGSTFVHTGDIQLGDNTTWTLTGTYYKLGNQPQGRGGNTASIPASTFIGARGAPTDGPVIGVTAYNNTNPHLPGTSNVLAVTKEGHIKPISGQANAKLEVASNVLLYTDPNSLKYPLSRKMQALAQSGGGTQTIDASIAGPFKITVADNTGFTIANPTNAATGAQITFDIVNAAGGAMGTITWGSEYALAGAFTNPADTKRRTITFYRDTAATKWVEVSRAAADI
jgi:hypothetical protein